MKIVMFGHKRIPSREGGVEIVVEELAARVAALGHEVTCYNRGGHHVSGAEFDATVGKTYRGIRLKKVWTLDKKGLAAVTSSFFAALCAAFCDADVVHIHAEGPAFMCWLPKLLGKKVIVTVHGLDWKREKWKNGFGAKYIRWGEKAAVRYADQIIVLSRNVQQYFRDAYGRETVFIPNGVAAPERVEPEIIAREYGLQKESYILFLGRLVPEKGVHYLIEAYKQAGVDKKLVIAGGGSDSDEYIRRLRQMAGENVIFTGFVQGRILSELYGNAYVYVLPSDVEGMPLSLLEAMSYGNCCLVSDIPECTEVVGEHAAIFPAGDVSALARELRRLCENADLTAQYKTNAQGYILGKYSWDDAAEKTLELYR